MSGLLKKYYIKTRSAKKPLYKKGFIDSGILNEKGTMSIKNTIY
jgi:hypothetical protein